MKKRKRQIDRLHIGVLSNLDLFKRRRKNTVPAAIFSFHKSLHARHNDIKEKIAVRMVHQFWGQRL